MSIDSGKLGQGLRIVWAIAAKDIADAVRNWTTATIVIGTLLVLLAGQALPYLIRMSETPPLFVYDAGDSRLVTELEAGGRFSLREVDSQQQLEQALVDLNAAVLGLAIPADVDQALEPGEEPEIEAFVVWSARGSAPEMAASLEEHLAEILGQPAQVDVAGNFLYPPAEGTGSLGMNATALVMTTVTIGAFVVSYLMMEEKQHRTMEALLASPASMAQIVAGKAVAGLFYCLTALVAAFAVNGALFVQWGTAILAAVCGAMVAVGLGLLVGMLFETVEQMSLWLGIPLVILVLPVMSAFTELSLPEPVAAGVRWIPTVVQARVFMLSFSAAGTPSQAWPELAVLLGSAGLLLAAVAWRLRRADR